jgi:hypothetical protein
LHQIRDLYDTRANATNKLDLSNGKLQGIIETVAANSATLNIGNVHDLEEMVANLEQQRADVTTRVEETMNTLFYLC